MQLDIQRRHAIRRAALPLFLERGFSAVTLEQVAEAVGLTEADVVAQFATTRQIVTEADYFNVIVRAFRTTSSELSCAAAWVVAIDEIATTMSQEEWDTEKLRNEIFAREEHAIGGLVAEIVSVIVGLNEAVAERSGLPQGSTPVSVFTGTILGTMLSMPLGFYPDAYAWVDAHAVAIEALGPSLDAMLRPAALEQPHA